MSENKINELELEERTRILVTYIEVQGGFLVTRRVPASGALLAVSKVKESL
jgi:hypothetical protein